MGSGARWRPIRRTLGLEGVSANAYTGAEAGDEVIGRHDERSPSAAGHEELYLVLSGRATFEIAGDELDAPAGTMIAIDPGIMRRAVAAEADTTVVVVGGEPGAAHPPAPFEYWYAADAHYVAGEHERGIEVLREGVGHHPTTPGLNYQLARHLARAGRPDEAVERLRVALESSVDGRIAEWAEEDAGLDSLRARPDFPRLGR